MAFPIVVGTRKTLVMGNATSVAPLLFDGSNVNGYLVIIIVVKDGTGVMTWPSGWTAITNAAGDDGGSASRVEARYRVIDGTEGFDGINDSITITDGSEEWAVKTITIKGHSASTSPPECAAATGTTGNGDPPSLNPTGWDAEDTLWMVFVGLDASGDVSGWPTNYTSNQDNANTGGTGGCSMGFATRNLNAASDDPGTFTNGSESWRALTLAVRPGSEGLNQALFETAVSATATVVAAFTTAIQMVGALTCSVAVAAALTTEITPVTSISGTANVTAGLTTEITAAAAVTGTATTAADLTVSSSALFEALVSGTATTAANLTTEILAVAAVTGPATVSGALTTEITMASAVSGLATIAADLTAGAAQQEFSYGGSYHKYGLYDGG